MTGSQPDVDFVDDIELGLLDQPMREYFVYHVINSHLPWLNKVGMGSLARIELWERRGWVVQSRLLLHERTDARAIERLLLGMNYVDCPSPRLVELKAVLASFGSIDGHTEMFDSPFLLGEPEGMETKQQHVVDIAATLRANVRSFFVG